MKYLKLFESFDDNQPVISALKDILSCIKSGKKITSKLNGGKIMDLHDNCDDPQVMEILSKAAEIAGEEAQGTIVDLKTQFDTNELEGLIRILEANPEKDETGMKVESFSKFISESHTKSVHISDDEMNLFSQEPALQELITNQKITLKNGEVLFDENDEETRDLLDQYLEIPGKVHESFDNTEINEREIDDFLGNGVRINVFLTDLLSETNLMLLMVNGEVYERRAGNKAWSKYSSKEEFKSKTGASLDDEYAGNASPELINLFDSVDDGRKHMIEMVYIDSQFDSPLLDSVLKNFK